MPCRCYEEEPSERMIEGSRVGCLLDEFFEKIPVDKKYWDGTCIHPRVHHNGCNIDQLTDALCYHLSKVDVTNYSLEIQMWWRDHQIADAKRIKEEAEQEELQRKKMIAVAKLTPEEKKLLGL